MKCIIFTVPWKSYILTEQNLANIKDNNDSTYITINKAECSLVELWLDDLNANSSLGVNINGIGR